MHEKKTYRLLLMENEECIVEMVSETHHKPYIAVQSGDEKDATKKRNDCAKAYVESECEVSKLNCSRYGSS